MSRAGGYVRFPDGTIKAYMYDGTVDMVYPALFDTSAEAWDAYGETKKGAAWGPIFDPPPIGDEEEVEVYSDYGGGFWWRGTATRNRIISPLFSDEIFEHHHDGAPDWLEGARHD